MKLNDYKQAMGGVAAPETLKQRIVDAATDGAEPSLSVSRGVNPVLRRILIIAAALVVTAGMLTGWLLMLKFIGGNADGTGSPAGSTGGRENYGAFVAEMNSESTLDGVKLKISGFTPEGYVLGVDFINNSGRTLVLGMEYRLDKNEHGVYSQDSLEKKNTVIWNEIAMELSDTQAHRFSYRLSDWSDSLESCGYRIDIPFYTTGSGTGNEHIASLYFSFSPSGVPVTPVWVPGLNGRLTVTMTDCPFGYLSVNVTGYDAGNDILRVGISNNGNAEFDIPYEFVLLRYSAGEYSSPADVGFAVGNIETVEAGETKTVSYNLRTYYPGGLTAGTYRITFAGIIIDFVLYDDDSAAAVDSSVPIPVDYKSSDGFLKYGIISFDLGSGNLRYLISKTSTAPEKCGVVVTGMSVSLRQDDGSWLTLSASETDMFNVKAVGAGLELESDIFEWTTDYYRYSSRPGDYRIEYATCSDVGLSAPDGTLTVYICLTAETLGYAESTTPVSDNTEPPVPDSTAPAADGTERPEYYYYGPDFPPAAGSVFNINETYPSHQVTSGGNDYVLRICRDAWVIFENCSQATVPVPQSYIGVAGDTVTVDCLSRCGNDAQKKTESLGLIINGLISRTTQEAFYRSKTVATPSVEKCELVFIPDLPSGMNASQYYAMVMESYMSADTVSGKYPVYCMTCVCENGSYGLELHVYGEDTAFNTLMYSYYP